MALTKVQTAGIATDAVANAHLADNAVTASEIAANAVTTAKINNDAVTADKLANTSVTAGSYGSATAIPAITVDAQGRITAASTNTVNTTTNLATTTASGSVTVTSSTGNNATISEATGSAAGVMSVAHHDKLDGIEASATADQTGSEILSLLASNNVGTSHIANNAVGTNEISADAVSFDKMQNIPSARFLGRATSGTGDVETLAAGDARTLLNVENGATADQTSTEIKSLLAGDNIGAAHIAANSIDSSELVAGAVDLEHMSSESVDEDNLKISNGGSNGQYLQKQSGNAGGLTWADVPAGVGGATGLDLNDSVPLRLGTGNDLSFYHDGSIGRLYNTAGSIVFRSADYYFKDSTGNEDVAKFMANGQCELYHNNSKKLETTSTGIDIPDTLRLSGGYSDIGSQMCLGADSGGAAYIAGYVINIQTGNNNSRSTKFTFSHDHFSPYANNSYDLGTSSLRWRNVYTNDLNLSNEGSANEVDGTWGNYTIQEGEDELFLLNRRNGKKYKFNLTEVS